MTTPGQPVSRKTGRPRLRGNGTTSDDPREDIVERASELFSAKGIEAVTMAEIAEAVGLQPPSVYYWYRSKSEILASILERVNRVPLAIVERERRAEGPMVERLGRLVREDVLALCGFPFDINEIHRLASRDPDGFSTYWEQRNLLDSEVAALLADGIESGELRDVDPILAARMLLACDEATQNWYRHTGSATPNHGFTAEMVADYTATMMVESLRRV